MKTITITDEQLWELNRLLSNEITITDEQLWELNRLLSNEITALGEQDDTEPGDVADAQEMMVELKALQSVLSA